MSTSLIAPAFSAESEATLALTSDETFTVSALPAGRGVYAIVADEAGLEALGLASYPEHGVVFVGRAERMDLSSTVRRHFQAGRTEVSELRRHVAALLQDELELSTAPCSPGSRLVHAPLTSDSEAALTAWMRAHLTVALWQPQGQDVDLAAVEGEILSSVRPALNVLGVDQPWERLTQACTGLRTARQSATL